MSLGDRVVAQAGELDVSQRSEDLGRARALNGDQRSPQRSVVERRVMAHEAFAQCGRDRFPVRRVGHDHEALVGDPIDDQVVDDPAVIGADHAVLRAAHGEPGRVTDQRGGEAGAGAGAADPHLAHVRQIEQSGTFADGPVLVEDALVLDRHLPAGKVDQPAAKRTMALDEGGLQHGYLTGAQLAADAGRRERLLDDLALGWECHEVARLIERHPADLLELVVVVGQVAAG